MVGIFMDFFPLSPDFLLQNALSSVLEISVAVIPCRNKIIKCRIINRSEMPLSCSSGWSHLQ